VNSYFCKLHPPRPSFAQDMTAAEGALMQQHAGYLSDWLAKGNVVTFGMVGDPAGAYGIAVMQAEDDDALRRITENDPVIRSGQGFRYETHLMPFGAVKA
jgi:uncharacterized protein YciI